ncbi:hypothetical protein AnigIFM56816_008221 [Aspergillus niger]|nr:hypothetical protein AnigIFM56816_008221 [Aspergillus niger]
MEKVRGVALAQRWCTMDSVERYKLIDKILEMEKELAGLKLPVYGSLFLRDSLPPLYQRHSLPSDLDPTGLFCVGPSCHRAHTTSATTYKLDFGPWTSVLDFALSVPHRQLDLIAERRTEVEKNLNRYGLNESVVEYYNLLQKLLLILPTLSQDSRIVRTADSVIWHTDLHLGNIYVSSDDPTIIEGVIDWQSAQAAPLFIQAQFPEFLRPPKDYTPGTEVPALPDNFDELDADEKERAIEAHVAADQSKYYEMSCLAYKTTVYDAIKLDRRLWEPFTCSQPFSNGSIVPLRNALIRISQDWELLELPDSCPFRFNEDDLERHNEQLKLYEDSLYLWDLVKGQIGTDNSGWVPLEQWESTNKANKYLFDMHIETMSEELPAEEAAKRWPFLPKDA